MQPLQRGREAFFLPVRREQVGDHFNTTASLGQILRPGMVHSSAFTNDRLGLPSPPPPHRAGRFGTVVVCRQMEKGLVDDGFNTSGRFGSSACRSHLRSRPV